MDQFGNSTPWPAREWCSRTHSGGARGIGHGWTPEAGSELGRVLLLGPQLCKSLEFTSQVKVAKMKKMLEAFAVGVSTEA